MPKQMSETVRGNLNFLSPASTWLARISARPRLVAAACVLTLSSLGWLCVALMQAQHTDVFAAICRPQANPQSLGLLLAMWAAMALAMMLPSAAPMILTYAEIADAAARKRIAVVSPVVLAAGYAAVWLGFAAFAASMQVALAGTALLDTTTGLVRGPFAAALFIAAGLYQFSSLKDTCLRQCRHPFPFFFTNWSTTADGVFRLGVRQGLFCLGCCWAAMLLMFALGVMNVLWMALLAVAMTVEKLVSVPRLRQAYGFVLIAAGVFLMVGVGL
jgi:predicted metal-binding membrane protein